MPITKTPAYQTSNGNTYATLEIAQRAELLKLLLTAGNATEEQANVALEAIFKELDYVKDILRCTGRKPRGKSKGNAKARTRKTATKEATE